MKETIYLRVPVRLDYDSRKARQVGIANVKAILDGLQTTSSDGTWIVTATVAPAKRIRTQDNTAKQA